MSGSMFELPSRRTPQLHPVPEQTRGFRIRIDLQHTKPPVWRRLDVPGGLTLPQLHDVVQTAMGWTDSHLHRFRTGNDRNAPEFLTPFDLEEGDGGTPEAGVRLDQVVAEIGDRLWYAYDFGDGWEHVLRVERVLDAPPAAPVCIAGKLACPPEDCGGTWGYADLAAWVRGGYPDSDVPPQFEHASDARAWLPPDWHPDVFDLDETNAALAVDTADPIPVGDEVASLLETATRHGGRGLRHALSMPATRGSLELDADEARRVTEPYVALITALGDGSPLSAAGYMNPAVVETVAEQTGVARWWFGKANREDLTPPIASLRSTARALGLVSVRSGRIAPTRVARKLVADPDALLDHIVQRLPIGLTPVDRHAGWSSLAVVGSELAWSMWRTEISELMYELGWRAADTPAEPPAADNPTLEVLDLLAGSLRSHSSRPHAGAAATLARRILRG